MLYNRSHSYPYLSISRHFSVPYGVVLTVADAVRSSHEIAQLSGRIPKNLLGHLSRTQAAAVDELRGEYRPVSDVVLQSIIAEYNWQCRIQRGEVRFDAEPPNTTTH